MATLLKASARNEGEALYHVAMCGHASLLARVIKMEGEHVRRLNYIGDHDGFAAWKGSLWKLRVGIDDEDN
ncbi:hypothetical protein ACLOJK_018605 [Asimina triloba]